MDDGLSQSSVECIIQDRKGFMWFGTQDGLNKYDGYSFSVYKNNSEDESSRSVIITLTLFLKTGKEICG